MMASTPDRTRGAFWAVFLSPRSHANESHESAPSVAARVSVVINFGNEQQNKCLRT